MSASPSRTSPSLARLRGTASAANRLGLIGMVLLLLASIALCGVTYQQLQGLRHSSESARAQLLAQSIAQRVQHAIAVGIPMQQLQGVEEFFQSRLSTYPDIDSIALVLADGTVLKQAQQRDVAPDASTSAVADVPITMAGKPLASVRLALKPSSAQAFAQQSALLLLPVIVLLAALAFLAARFSEAQGPRLRNFATRLAIRSIRNGRYDRSFAINQRKEYDLRVQGLGHTTRTVHESLVRVRRLIASLRVTEPQLARRERLDQLLHSAESTDHFAENGLFQIRVVAAEAQAFWACLLISMASMSLAALVTQASLTAGPVALQTYSLALLAVSACAGALLNARLRWRMISTALVSSILVCGIGLIWASGWLDAWPAHITLLATHVLCGLVAGGALHACQNVQLQPQYSNNAIATNPRWAVAALSAWSVALVWLAPALARTTHSAIGLHLGAAALALPAVCSLFYLLQWNQPRSPWRFQPRARSEAWLTPAGLAACAVGVVAVLFNTHAFASDTLLTQSALAIGLFAGLSKRLLSRRHLALLTVLCALVWVLDFLLAQNPLGHNAVACLAAAGFGFVSGSLLTLGGPKRELPALHFLVSVAIGAVLAGIGLHMKLPAQMLAVIGTVLLGAGIWRLGKPTARSARTATQGEHHAA